MPVLAIPGGPTIRWSSRRNTLVAISHRLPVRSHRNSSDDTYIPLTIKLPRETLRDMARESSLRVETQLARALLNATRHPPKVRSRTISLLAPLGSSIARLHFPASALEALRANMPQDSDGEELYQEQVALRIAAWYFTDFIPELVSASPKRHGIRVFRLTRFLPAALLGAHHLVVDAQRDSRLKTRIKEIIEEDREFRAYIKACIEMKWSRKLAMVVGLVDRAFRGAWEKLGHPGLIYTCSKVVASRVILNLKPSLATRYRNPARVLDEYLYGSPVKTRIARMLGQQRGEKYGVWNTTLNAWERLYLSSPGTAAKEFQLLP